MNKSDRAPIVDVLNAIKDDTGIASTYSHYVDGHAFPYMTYIGNGQTQMLADGTAYWSANTWQVELYFTKKDERLEEAIETAFLSNGWNFDKSEDIYLEDVGAYYVYYSLA